MNNEIRQTLLKMGEDKLKDFSVSLIPGAKGIIGIRLPKLREYAKVLAKTQGEAALEGDDRYYEETMLRGMIIGYLKTDDDRKFGLIQAFIPLIDNWGVCDSFCSTLKFTRKCLGRMWDFLHPYIHSDKEFEQRFAAVMLLDYFVSEVYIDQTLTALSEINTAAYYSSMAAAWALVECYIKFPGKAEVYITEKRFDKDTHNRAIRKICDSYRVELDKKSRLKELVIKSK